MIYCDQGLIIYEQKLIKERSTLRVYADVDEQTLGEINQAAKNFNLSKANLIAKAIDQFLHPPEQTGPEIDQLRSEIDQARSESDQLRADLDQARLDANKRWSEMNAAKTENAQLKRDLEAARSNLDQTLIKLDQLRAEIDQAKIERQGLTKDLENIRKH